MIDFETEEWKAYRACAGVPVEVFYPDTAHKSVKREATKYCDRCPVQIECLLFSMRSADTRKFGIFGGLSGPERKDFFIALGAKVHDIDDHQFTREHWLGRGPKARDVA